LKNETKCNIVKEKKYLWELHSTTLLSTNQKNFYFIFFGSIDFVSVRYASVQFKTAPIKKVRLTINLNPNTSNNKVKFKLNSSMQFCLKINKKLHFSLFLPMIQ
jgi:hypothetical protein